MEVLKFTFGPFSENTYVLVDQKTKECIVVDPGMYDSSERAYFTSVLESKELKPTLLLNTHCHIDHVMGNAFIHDQFGLSPQTHVKAIEMLERADLAAKLYGLNYDLSPAAHTTLEEGKNISFNSHELEVLFTPGHSPGHVVFFNKTEGYLIGGDVLFKGSVGRVDLPGSVPADLVKSIQNKVYLLPEETIIYSGHGPETTIGVEKKTNPLVSEHNSIL